MIFSTDKGVQAFAQVGTIYLSNLNATHIRFSSEIKSIIGDEWSRAEIAAKSVRKPEC